MHRIGYITTFPPQKCGISTYTNYLCAGLLRQSESEVVILADKRSKAFCRARFKCILTYDHQQDYAENIIDTVKKIKPDTVHFQHEFGIFGTDGRFLQVLERLVPLGVKTCVTLHTIRSEEAINFGIKPEINFNSFNRSIGQYADKVIVHHKSQSDVLVNHGVELEKIIIIPHGTEIMKRIDKQQAMRILGLPLDAKIIEAFGFIQREKNPLVIIEALPQILKVVPEVYFLIAGHPHPYSMEYLNRCKERAEKLGCRKRVIFVEEFIPHGQEHLYLGAADVMVYPYDDPYLCVSGALHLALGSGKPLIASAIPRLIEIRDEISPQVSLPAQKPDAWAEALIKVLTDEEFRRKIISQVERYARATSWENIALAHLNLYQSLNGH